MRIKSIVTMIAAAALAGAAWAQTAQTTQPSAEQRMNDMLRPPGGSGKPLLPTAEPPATDKNSGKGSGAVAPNTADVKLQREGTYIFDRIGHLTRSADGSQAEFMFEADGKTLKDPPVMILPNLKLMTMEDANRSTNRDLPFRVTGMLTEYRGRNYLLLEKVVVPPEQNAQF